MSEKKNILIYGTFDLFHAGHKNILLRAKEIANKKGGKLIVGVTTSDFDKKRGKIDVFQTYEERVHGVSNMNVADIIIPEKYNGQKIDDIKTYEAASIVFGSDWEGKMDYLNEYCEVVYLPRTKGVSSTMIRNRMGLKTAIIIGGSSDIGIGGIKMLINRGFRIIGTYNKNKPEYEHELLTWIELDTSVVENVYNFVDLINTEVVNIDIFIYNAGTTCRKKLIDIDYNEIIRVFNVNVISCLLLISKLKGKLSDNAKIIVTGSQMGITPHSTSLLYGVSKECLHSFVKNFVKELDGTNITINAIAPGFIETKWQSNKPKDVRDNINKKTMLHRFGSVDEVIKGFEFCLDNNFVNGSIIEINGGYCYE